MNRNTSTKPLVIVLASGGMDSCVTTAIAAQKYRLAMLHVNYGQRTEKRELQAFRDICNFYTVPENLRLATSIEYLSRIGGSSLTDKNIPVTNANLSATEIPTSYIPFRNAHLISIAVSWGEVIGASKIFIGAVEEDSSGYPDCREAYFRAFNQVITLGTHPDTRLEIVTPLIHLKKYQIVQRGIELEAPLHLSWSCYRNEDVACGTCDSCALRLRGFQIAGVPDLLPYSERPDYVHSK